MVTSDTRNRGREAVVHDHFSSDSGRQLRAQLRATARVRGQSTKGARTARPVIVSGVIMMNKLRVPSAQGTGPSFHSEVNVYSRVTRSADPSTKTLQPDSRSSSMSSI